MALLPLTVTAPPPAPSQADLRVSFGFRSKRLLLTCVMLLTVGLRVPAFAWSAISDDEAIYDATAMQLVRGGVMYRDAIDHKPPGLAYSYAWLYRLLPRDAGAKVRLDAVHALGAAAALGTALGLWVVASQLARHSSPVWAAALYALSSTAKVPFDGLAVNGELLMGLPSIWALALALWAGRAPRRWSVVLDLCSGMLVGLAMLFKWQAAIVGLGLLALGPGLGGGLRAYLGRMVLWGLGAALPLGATVAYFVHCGALFDAWYWGLQFNRLYLAAGTSGVFWWRRLALSVAGAVLPSVVLYAAGFWQLRQLARAWRANKVPSHMMAVAVWAMLSLWAVMLGGRFFGHYYLQVELPLCLLAAGPVARVHRVYSRSLGALLGAPALAFFVMAAMPSTTLAMLNSDNPTWPMVGSELASYSQPNDTLFVWGNAPLLYHFSGLPMGTRYSFCNYLTGLSPATPSETGISVASGHGEATERAWRLLGEDFSAHPPALIVDTAVASWKGYGLYPMAKYPALAAFVEKHYHQVGLLAGKVPVYRWLH